ncbi:mannose-6-phosphate isomerase type 1 [Leucobacter komagatae]|uniref:mannose-6-phosphate isomerase n=1 Tax=Leucobacter komagatae TaxID=55969 RepID=A0A542Y6S7_9MICO|nr:mannose-6-phosphate isomerase, class I [Leucobacter komagatae]TQL43781.1 mannose-6-phosphate isomerase type 1 [Leucobacter komagatae]
MVLIFIENTPRAYAWGSTDALPAMLGHEPTGEPQAELWLGDHPGSPASVAKATPVPHTLIELIEQDPERYGVNGGPLPFLLKVLAIGAPLSLQVHPNEAQAAEGFAAENAAGVPVDAPNRNYRDPNHKPELLVALSEVTALSGFRSLADTVMDLRALAAAAPLGGGILWEAADRLVGAEPEAAREAFMRWAFSGGADVEEAQRAVVDAIGVGSQPAVHPDRLECLRGLAQHYPGDPGVLVSLLLHHVRLAPGEAVYLGARQLHAYLGGIAVEVMAASDNVLRAGLTQKHIDIPEMLRILHFSELGEPRMRGERVAAGLCAWRPGVPDFTLFRARVENEDDLGAGGAFSDAELLGGERLEGAAAEVVVEAPAPVVLIVTAGRVLVSRPESELAEMANVARGQSLYVSAGEPIHLTGSGEVFLATIGE